MAGARTTNLDEEKRSYGGLWLVLSLLLLVSAIWVVADDNLFRRPWKKWQAGFNRLEIARVEEAIRAEQARLDADPAYQEAVKRLADARAALESGETAAEIARVERELNEARLADQSKDLNLRFVKSELEELRFQYDDALHHHRDTAAIAARIAEKERLRAEREKIYKASQDRIAALEARLKELRGGVKAAEDALAALTTTRDELQNKLETISLGYFPGPKAEPPFIGYGWQPKIPKIRQVVMEEFDRNNFEQPIARVDRCMSCHAGIDKAGFEDQPNPWKTHPRRELFLGHHPVDRFGCTPCHNGDGPAVNSPEKAHGNYYDEAGHLVDMPFQEHTLLRHEKMQANCIKCHADVQALEGAEVIARGEKLFVELGCHGCHLVEGYEELQKEHGVTAVAPSLRRIGAKVDRGWLVRWIMNPHAYRPHTRMPNFAFDETQAVQIAAYLLATSKGPSEEWAAAHAQAPAVQPALAARGKDLVDAIGCRACHAFAPDEVAGRIGANKDIAPNLANVAEKTDARWMYHWIRNPRGYSDIARMPNLRLSDEEAQAITAYLVTLGAPKPAAPDLDAKLADPANVAAGEKLVRKYGCAGCHDIPGMEKESRIGAELSAFGDKTKEELFFGDRTDLRQTWDEWTYHKLLTPRTYATKWIEQLMPQFDLADEDIKALRVFLKSRSDEVVPVRYRDEHEAQEAIVRGRRLIARYNCTGCHVIGKEGGDVRRLYEAQPTFAPPILTGEGRKVQPNWFFGFIKQPVAIRPWLQIRMPTFGLTDDEAYDIVRFFEAVDGLEIPYVYVARATLDADLVEHGRTLASKDVFDCFSCHQRGAQKPEGPPEGWAPDLALAHARLNPDWIVEWLRDPQKLMPGTKMPSYYPDPAAPDGPPDILGGDDEAQIRALREYVLSLGLAPATPSPTQTARVEAGGPGD